MASGKIKIKGGPDLETWDEIADVLGVARSTAQVWGTEGMPVLSWGRRIAAYSEEVLAWMKSKGKKRRTAPKPAA
jgi:hypothetical protein